MLLREWFVAVALGLLDWLLRYSFGLCWLPVKSVRLLFAVQGVLVDRHHLLRAVVGKHEELREWSEAALHGFHVSSFLTNLRFMHWTMILASKKVHSSNLESFFLRKNLESSTATYSVVPQLILTVSSYSKLINISITWSLQEPI